MPAAICILLGLHVIDSLLTYPNYLAYFSPAVGGPSQGYRQLVDSNLDWGQELPALAKWLKERETAQEYLLPFYLEYSGSSDPRHYGIDYIPLQDSMLHGVSPENLYPLRAGTYCVSVTTLAAPNEHITRWSQMHEKGFRELVEEVRAIPAEHLDSEQAISTRIACGYMQFARLLAYLRGRVPDDRINYALHIYELTEQELHVAMHGPLEELQQ